MSILTDRAKAKSDLIAQMKARVEAQGRGRRLKWIADQVDAALSTSIDVLSRSTVATADIATASTLADTAPILHDSYRGQIP